MDSLQEKSVRQRFAELISMRERITPDQAVRIIVTHEVRLYQREMTRNEVFILLANIERKIQECALIERMMNDEVVAIPLFLISPESANITDLSFYDLSSEAHLIGKARRIYELSTQIEALQ